MGAPDVLTALAEQHWEAVLRRSPIFATLLGDHRFDDRIDDLSEEAEDVERGELVELRAAVSAIEPADLAAPERATRGLLLTDVDRRLEAIDLRVVELASDQMGGVHVGLLTAAPEVVAPTPGHAEMLATRNRQVDRFLEQAIARFRAGLSAGRTPARACILRSINTVDGYLGSTIDSDPFVTYAAPEGWEGEAAWRDQLAAIAREVIRPAFERLRAVLVDELLPVARPDDRCGVGWLDGGNELYASLVREHTTLPDADPVVVHDLGLAELERLRSEYEELGRQMFGTRDVAEVFRHLRDDAALRYTTPEEILRDAREFVAAATDAAPSWFARVPEASCTVTQVPDFLAPDAPAAYYFPPTEDGLRGGTYYVNVHAADERTRFEAAAVAFHEAVPGHHFQLALASESTELPRFQRLGFGNTAFVEGWALYAERLADEMSLYRDDVDRAGMLVGDSWRCCRLVVDTGLHAFGWSRQRAIEFMRDNAPVAPVEISVEIDRYIGLPGQALGYKVGQLEIQRLRRDAESRLGDAFDLRAFHDAVLGSGTISLPVLRDVIADAFWPGTPAP